MSLPVYIEVKATSTQRDGNNYSGYDTTSGYYISYNAIAGEGGGYTGTGWYLDDPYNPFAHNDLGITDPNGIVEYYNRKQDLNDIFSTWIQRVGEREVSKFCSDLMWGSAYVNGCITMLQQE